MMRVDRGLASGWDTGSEHESRLNLDLSARVGFGNAGTSS